MCLSLAILGFIILAGTGGGFTLGLTDGYGCQGYQGSGDRIIMAIGFTGRALAGSGFPTNLGAGFLTGMVGGLS